MFFLLAGCNTPAKTTKGNDPLMTGGSPLPRNLGKSGPGPSQGTAGTNPATGQPQASNTPPPFPGIPTAGTGFSPAALATGRPHPFDRERDLQINDWPRGSQNNGWTAPSNTLRPGNNGVMLRPPEPLGDTGSLPSGPASTPSPMSTPGDPFVAAPGTGGSNPGASGGVSYEQVVAQLQARGVQGQKPEMVGPGEWKFSCSVPNPANPNQQRTYQARGRDLLEAMQAVLRKIDQDLRP